MMKIPAMDGFAHKDAKHIYSFLTGDPIGSSFHSCKGVHLGTFSSIVAIWTHVGVPQIPPYRRAAASAF